MSLAREDQQLARNVQFVQSAVKQIILKHRNANIVSPGNHMRRRADFVDLVNRSFATIAVGSFPGQSTKKISVVEGSVIVAPVGDVLDRPSAGDGSLKASGLRDQPVRHVTAITVATDRQLLRVRNSVFHQRIDAGQYIFSRTRNNLGNNLQRKLVSVAR